MDTKKDKTAIATNDNVTTTETNQVTTATVETTIATNTDDRVYDFKKVDNFSDSFPAKSIDGTFIIKGTKLIPNTIKPGVLKAYPAIGSVKLRVDIGGASVMVDFCLLELSGVVIVDSFWDIAAKIGLDDNEIEQLKLEINKRWCYDVVIDAVLSKEIKTAAAAAAKKERKVKFAKLAAVK